MANQINVFELTNTALKSLNESTKPTVKKAKKVVSKKKIAESVKATKKPVAKKLRKEAVRKISCGKLRLESMQFVEDADSDEFDFTPEDEVVVVVDPEMDEVPASEEEAKEAAEELVGDTICKCSICGANYVCDCDSTIEEDVDGEVETCVEDGTCPICGEEAPQIVVGEIVAADDASVADTDDIEDAESEEDTAETDETDTDKVPADDADKTTQEVPAEEEEEKLSVDDDDFFVDVDNADDTNESVVRKSVARKPVMRRESARNAKRPVARKSALQRERVATARTARKPMAKRPVRVESQRTARPVMNRVRPTSRVAGKQIDFNECALNRLFTKFAKENYDNVASVRFTEGKVVGSRLTVEGVVRTTKGTKRTIKLVAENFKPVVGKMKLQCKEFGPFTESVRMPKNKVPFVVECDVRTGKVTPVSMKYAYVATKRGLKEGKGRVAKFTVTGIVK